MTARAPVRLLEPLCALIASAAAVTLVAFPAFSGSESGGRDPELDDCLAHIRTAVWQYGLEHETEAGPLYPAQNRDLDTLLAQLTGHSDALGRIDDEFGKYPLRYGPYLNELPVNPRNGRGDIRIGKVGTESAEPNGTAGWIYLPSTGEVRADVR